jgi:hypothetical protein
MICVHFFSYLHEWEANIDKLGAGGMRAMARSYRTELRQMSYHVRRLEAQLAALGKENDQLRQLAACDAGCCCSGCAAEARAQSAEVMLAEMVARHHALLETVRGQASDRERRYLRRSGVAVYHI